MRHATLEQIKNDKTSIYNIVKSFFIIKNKDIEKGFN
jgi:hypothetical protein